MNLHFGANVVKNNTNYGLATYSKYKIISQKHVYLSSTREQRGFLHTTVRVKEKKLHILTFSTELDRIDYMFVSNNIEVKSYEVLIKNMSDHYPIVAKISI